MRLAGQICCVCKASLPPEPNQRPGERYCGIPHINVHRLRHTYATNLANANIDSLILKDLMGHRSLSTTARYFKLNDTTVSRGYFSAIEYLRQ